MTNHRTINSKFNRTGARVSSPSSGVRPGARALNLELPTSFGLRLFMGALCLLAGSLLFTNSAYATSYLNVSSSGSVSFGSIRPTSSGTSSTGSDTLTVHTDCNVGYSVYVSGQNGKDTNLTNGSASSDNIISTSSNAIGSAGSLNSNTWGLNYENTGAYVGLPTYANATNKAFTSKSDVEEASTVDIYYGIKVDTAVTPGTYTGDVLYTVLMDSSCLAYTVVFDANGGSGEMSNQSIMAGTKTALDENSFARDGYTFLGWSTKANGKTETAVDGVGTEADVDYADKAEVTDLTSGGSSITLYAIWEQDVETMQGWTGCSALTTGQAVTLKDTRDNKRYAVKKLPDGKCWMVQNLALGMNATEVGLTLIPENTNIDNNTTYYLPPVGKQGSDTIDKSSTLTATTTANFSSSNDNRAKTQFRAKDSSITNDSDTGYYNFYTATLGFSSYEDGVSSGSSTRDICPKGWRLPWTSDSGTTRQGSAEFYALALTYNSASNVWTNYIAPTSTGSPSPYTSNDAVRTGIHTGVAANGNNYAGFSYSGYWSSASTSASGLGLYGNFWSSSVYEARFGYYLSFNSSSVYPQSGVYKYLGYTVRCMAQDNYTITYSSDGADSGNPSKATERTVYENESVTMPTVGSMIKDGYEFKGWAFASGATTATYQAEETVALSALLTAASSAGQTTTSGSTITLYPVWEALPTAMQDFICSSLAGGTSATLRDTRDNQRYSIYRFPTDVKYAGTSTVANVAGKCIMTKDLNLGAVASVSGASSTIEANGEMALSPNDSGFSAPDGSGESITVPTTSQTITNGTGSWGNGDSSTSTYFNRKYTTSGTDDYAGRGYYSWGAAMLACPKNWRLPTADEYVIGSGWEGQTGGLAAIVKGNNAAATISNIISAPYSFALGGLYSGSFGSAPSSGFYWSSTQYDSAFSRTLTLGSANGLARNSNNKYSGFSVRCIIDLPTTYRLYYSGVGFATANKPEAQTYASYETSHTFTLPSAKPTYNTTGTILTFSNYTYNGITYNPGDTITLSSSSPSAALAANWARSCTISSSTGCKLADNRTWIFGYGGNSITWDNMFTNSTGADGHDATVNSSYNGTAICPSGYSAPSITVYDSLVQAYGGTSFDINRSGYQESTGVLYKVLGLSNNRSYWSSTENSSSNKYRLFVGSGASISVNLNISKTDLSYVLCYK